MHYGQWPIKGLDGGFVPGNAKSGPEGMVRLTHVDGFTILGFRDNSIDSRGGSHSTFLVPGNWYYEEALAMAADAFPFVFQRLADRGVLLHAETSRV